MKTESAGRAAWTLGQADPDRLPPHGLSQADFQGGRPLHLLAGTLGVLLRFLGGHDGVIEPVQFVAGPRQLGAQGRDLARSLRGPLCPCGLDGDPLPGGQEGIGLGVRPALEVP